VTAILLHSRLALAGLVRSPGRTVLRVVVVAAAVALLAGMLLFIGHSLRTASAPMLVLRRSSTHETHQERIGIIS